MRAALIVALLAVLVRLVPYSDSGRPLFSDERDYDQLARTLAATGRFEEEGRATAHRAIGYPALVAAIYHVVGPRPEAVRVVQAILDGTTALLLFLLLRRRGNRAALSAAVLWAAFPPAILYAHLIRPETAATLLLVASAAAFSEEASLSRGRRVLLGTLLGMTILVKPEFVILLAIVPFVVERGPRRGQRAAVILAGALVMIVPWIARNALEVGAPTLSTSFGVNLLIGNHPGATGGYAPDVPDSMRPRATGEAAASAEAFRNAASYIAKEPGRFVAGIARKWALVLMSESELVVTAFHPDPGETRSSFRSKARALPAWLHAAVSLPYAAILLLGTIGFMREPRADARPFFLAVVAASLLAHGLAFGGSRFHFPWTPFLAGYAALFVADRRAGVNSMPAWSLLLAAAFCALAIAVWIVEIRIVWGS